MIKDIHIKNLISSIKVKLNIYLYNNQSKILLEMCGISHAK